MGTVRNTYMQAMSSVHNYNWTSLFVASAFTFILFYDFIRTGFIWYIIAIITTMYQIVIALMCAQAMQRGWSLRGNSILYVMIGCG